MNWLKLNTLKQKFFIAFLTFVSVSVLIAFISAWSYHRYQKLNAVISLAEEIQLYNLKVINTEQDFFYYEVINPQFFKTGKSDYLIKHEKLITELTNKLDSFPKKVPSILGQYTNTTVNNIVTKSSKQILEYKATFEEIVKLTEERGFKDFGLEGRMRNTVHILEDKSPIPDDKILMLRRHEKDYIIRKDAAYSKKLNDLVNVLLTDVEKMNLPAKEEDKWMFMLQSYRKDFMRLVELENKVGMKQNIGLRQELKQYNELLEAQFQQLSSSIKKQIINTQTQLYYFYIVLIIFILIVTFFASSLLANNITKPITRLKEEISLRIREMFGLSYLPKNQELETPDEILTLKRDFNFLIQEIKEQLNQVRQNNVELEAQNEELNAINTQLVISENNLKKLNKVKDKFFSIISHDLRSPLHSLAGFLGILKNHSNGFSSEETKKFAENMEDAVSRILELLENLLNWSLSQTDDIDYKPKEISIQDTFNKNLALYAKNAQKKGINLRIDLKEEQNKLIVWADQNMLDFIIRNLISNAIKFTEEGGEIILTAREEDSKVVILVSDTGVGIKKEYLDKIFQEEEHFSEPGTRLEKGTGFGLMLCKDFVEKQEGKICIESEEGKGSTVYFTLTKLREKTKKSSH